MTDWESSQAAELEFWKATWKQFPPATRKLSPAVFARRLSVIRINALMHGHGHGFPPAHCTEGTWWLEPGCGPIPLVTAFTLAKRRVAIDPLLPEYAAMTGRSVGMKVNGVLCATGCIEDFDWWRDHMFDYVLLSDALGHFKDAEVGMTNILAVTAENGHVLLDEPIRPTGPHNVQGWEKAEDLGNWLMERWGDRWQMDYVRMAQLHGEKRHRMFTRLSRRVK